LVDSFSSRHHYYLILELCRGGDLLNRIAESGRYNERMAARCCRQLASALAHIHAQGIIHRDLKPENILLTDDGVDSEVKLADFGLAKLLKTSEQVARTRCGTWIYAAPEVLMGRPYTKAVDVWALGVLMFILYASLCSTCARSLRWLAS
jgi:serine/threonine protein kinase